MNETKILQDLKNQYSLVNGSGSFITKEEFGFLLETIDEQQKLIEEWFVLAKEYAIKMLRYRDALNGLNEYTMLEAMQDIIDEALIESKEN